MELPGALSIPSSENKNNPPRERFLYSGKMELSNSNIKKFLKFLETRAPEKFLIFSQKKACLIFRGTETPKKFVILQEIDNFLMFQEKEALKNILYLRK